MLRSKLRSMAPRLAVVALLVVACGESPGPGASATLGPVGSVAPTGSPAGAATPPPAATATATTAAPATSGPGTAAPSPTQPPIAITEVECLAGQTVRLHIAITAEGGIPTYAVWSTWGGGGDTTRSFPTPYTNHIDEEIEFTHAIKDPEPGRIHQFGLAVTVVGIPDPIIVYAIEPENRCPGH